MRFLVDNQLPMALCGFLISRGVECQHVLDLGLAEATDFGNLATRRRERTDYHQQGQDFVHLATAVKTGARFVWVRLGNCRSSALLVAFDRLWPRIEASLLAGDEIVEIRG